MNFVNSEWQSPDVELPTPSQEDADRTDLILFRLNDFYGAPSNLRLGYYNFPHKMWYCVEGGTIYPPEIVKSWVKLNLIK